MLSGSRQCMCHHHMDKLWVSRFFSRLERPKGKIKIFFPSFCFSLQALQSTNWSHLRILWLSWKLSRELQTWLAFGFQECFKGNNLKKLPDDVLKFLCLPASQLEVHCNNNFLASVKSQQKKIYILFPPMVAHVNNIWQPAFKNF